MADGARIADAALGAALSVPQCQLRDRAVLGVGGEVVEPQGVGVGEAQLGAEVRPFLADHQSHALRSAGQAVPVELGDPGAVADLAAGFDGASRRRAALPARTGESRR